ncbi:MAG: hypothetical protein PHX83_07725 [Acidobacteriia bacterium]|nr:hypothetical protein [Terriglobia bacterium]
MFSKKHAVVMLWLLISSIVVWCQTPPSTPPMIMANSPEDKALRVIESETDAAKRVTLLDQFVKDFPAMAYAVEVNELYTFAYQSLKDNAKVVDHAERAVAMKSNDIDVYPVLINTLLDMRNQPEKAYDYAQRYQKLVQGSDWSPAGRTISADERARIQGDAKSLLDAAHLQKEYNDLQKAYAETDPDQKISLLEAFVKTFPDSKQVCSAFTMLAVGYLQKRDVSKAASNAQDCLKAEPDNIEMVVLLADLQVEDKTKAAETAGLVKKAVELSDALDSQPVPDGQTEADWTKRKNYMRGTAHGLRGYIDLKVGLYSKGLPDLQLAYKLLGNDSATLYRLGFCLAKLHRNKEAETYLTQAAGMPGAYQLAAKRALTQLER